VRVGPAQELPREVADGAGAGVDGPVVEVRPAGVDEEPGAVVGAEAARVGRGDVEVVVDAAAAEDADGAAGAGGEGRAEEEPRERPRAREQAPHQRVPLAADHVAPRAAHERHAAAVDAAGDAAQDQALGVHVEVLQALARRRVHGAAGWGGSQEDLRLRVAAARRQAGWWKKKEKGRGAVANWEGAALRWDLNPLLEGGGGEASCLVAGGGSLARFGRGSVLEFDVGATQIVYNTELASNLNQSILQDTLFICSANCNTRWDCVFYFTRTIIV